jgi:hypothetical protein
VLQVKSDCLVMRRTHTQASALVSGALEECHGVLVQLPAKTAAPIGGYQVEEVHVSYGGIVPEPTHFVQ